MLPGIIARGPKHAKCTFSMNVHYNSVQKVHSVRAKARHAMADTQISMSEARQQLARLVNRVAYGGERIVLEAHGEPKAALVSIEDLERLRAEPAVRPSPTEVLQRLAALRERIGQRMEAAGIHPEESTEAIRQIREERDDEILGLR